MAGVVYFHCIENRYSLLHMGFISRLEALVCILTIMIIFCLEIASCYKSGEGYSCLIGSEQLKIFRTIYMTM